MAKLFKNSTDPDQMLHSAASDLGLHYLPITFLEWVKAGFLVMWMIQAKPNKNVLLGTVMPAVKLDQPT